MRALPVSARRILLATAVTSCVGLGGLKAYEGYKATPYIPGDNTPTVCYGHTGPDVKMGQPARTPAECDALLKKDVAKFEAVVRRNVKPDADGTIIQREFDAMVSFTYNIGEAAFKKSTFLRNYNAKKKQAAADQMLRWVYVNGNYFPGLKNRRVCERAYFLGEHNDLVQCKQYYNESPIYEATPFK